MKIGVIGNTILTYKALELFLRKGYQVEYVFGLPEQALQNKVNSCDIKSFCSKNNIAYYITNDWNLILEKDVRCVYELGDSRIVPAFFLEKNVVIGNHGAILPSVQGAASLVWGRMLNNGKWGVSLMKLSEMVDRGNILKTKEITYDKSNTTMEEFVEMCDAATIDCLEEYLQEDHSGLVNEKWQVKIRKGTNSMKAVQILNFCVENKINVYLPPRQPEDAKVDSSWCANFIDSFESANNSPYPKYYYETDGYNG